VVATGGAAAPAILAGAAIMGGVNAGISVASNVASGQPISVDNALGSFAAGYALGPIAMVTEGGDSEIGGIPEQLQNAVDTSGRTDIAQRQLAKILGGQPEVSIKLDDFGMGPRRYDVWASPNTGAELKV